MPCRNDDYPPEPTVSKKTHDLMRKDLDTVTRLLCSLCRRLTKVDQDYFIEDDAELSRWWVKHEVADRKREAEEQAVALKEKKKQNALNKLSKEEKELLGIKL